MVDKVYIFLAQSLCEKLRLRQAKLISDKNVAFSKLWHVQVSLFLSKTAAETTKGKLWLLRTKKINFTKGLEKISQSISSHSMYSIST